MIEARAGVKDAQLMLILQHALLAVRHIVACISDGTDDRCNSSVFMKR